MDEPSVKPQLTPHRNLLSNHSVHPPSNSQYLIFDVIFQIFPKLTAQTPCGSALSDDLSFSPGTHCKEVQGNATGHCHITQFPFAQVPLESQADFLVSHLERKFVDVVEVGLARPGPRGRRRVCGSRETAQSQESLTDP